MPVRDYRPLADVAVPWDQGFDTARAVKSEEELASVEESFRLNEDGVRAALAAYEVGKTEAEVMGEAERVFAARGTYRTTMDMVLTGPEGAAGPEFKHPSATRRIEQDDLLLYGLEIAALRRPLGRVLAAVLRRRAEQRDARGDWRRTTSTSRQRRATMRAGATAHDVHMAVSKAFHDRGFKLGHVTGHSIGMTMIEFPRVGEGNEVELRENMVDLDAPARDHPGRAGVPVHAGHVARHAGRRGAVLAGADPDLRGRVRRCERARLLRRGGTAEPGGRSTGGASRRRASGPPGSRRSSSATRSCRRPPRRRGRRSLAARHRRGRHLEPLTGDDGAPGGVGERALGGRLLLGLGVQARELRVGLARPDVRAAGPRDARVHDHPPACARGRTRHVRGRDLLGARLPAADADARATGAHVRGGRSARR